MNKIRNLSRVVRYYLGFHIAFNVIAHFVTHVHHWTYTLAYDNGLHFKTMYELNKQAVDIFTLPLWQRVLVSCAAFPSILLEALGFYSLMKLMSFYEKGVYFSEQTARLFRMLGVFIAFGEIAKIIEQLPVSYCLTFMNPPGQRMIAISASNHNLTGIMLALAIILVGWVMERGARLQKDSDATI